MYYYIKLLNHKYFYNLNYNLYYVKYNIYLACTIL